MPFAEHPNEQEHTTYKPQADDQGTFVRLFIVTLLLSGATQTEARCSTGSAACGAAVSAAMMLLSPERLDAGRAVCCCSLMVHG